MKKNLKGVYSLFITTLFIILLGGCGEASKSNSEGHFDSINQDNDLSISSISVPDEGFLGDSVNLIENKYGDPTIDYVGVRKAIGQGSSTIDYSFVETSQAMTQKIYQETNVGLDVTYGGFGLSSEVNTSFLESLNFEGSHITIFATKVVIDHTLFLEGETLKQEAIDLLHQNSTDFQNKYGDVYVEQADMGGRFYIAYQADISTTTEYSQSELSWAVETKFNSIFKGDVDNTNLEIAEEMLTSVTTKGLVYATGRNIVVKDIYSREDFEDLQIEFDTYYSDPDAELSVVKYHVTPFHHVYGSESDYFDIESYLENQLEDEIESQESIVPVLGVQLCDHGSGKNTGTIRYSNENTGWTDWAGDSNNYNPDCMRIGLFDSNYEPIEHGVVKNLDFRLAIQLSDGGSNNRSKDGSVRYTPWASDGGGWSSWAGDSNYNGFDVARIKLETRELEGYEADYITLGLQLTDKGTSSKYRGTIRYTSTGWTEWAKPKNGKDPDSVRIYLEVEDSP